MPEVRQWPVTVALLSSATAVRPVHERRLPEGDHLHRACLHCGYERIELALDTPLMAQSKRLAAYDALVTARTEETSRYLDMMTWR